MITIKHKGNFRKTNKFLKASSNLEFRNILDKYGKDGVSALSKATPVDSGLTAASWDYTITVNARGVSITWTNSNIQNGVPIAIILQYGHATRHGGYVQGRDYINPALQPIFDRMTDDLWKEVVIL